MKRYHFRLESVARLRRIEEDKAREALQKANLRLRALTAERERLHSRYVVLTKSPAATDGEAFLAERQRLELAAGRVHEADANIAAQVTTVAFAQIAYRQAAQRVEALDRLDARQREEYEQLALREEGRLIDDLVTGQYVRQHAPAVDGAR